MKPLLQLALDNASFEEALKLLQTGVAEAADIIEAGTLLLCAEGARAVSLLRTMYPDKKLTADFKIADAGAAFGRLLLDRGADLVTVICSAADSTKAAVKAEADRHGAAVQIELYGSWTPRDAQRWKEMGITHVIYHRSRDLADGWGDSDLGRIKELCEMGMDVTAAGGIGFDELRIFEGLPLFAVICGRSVRDAADPKEELVRMRKRIDELWG